MNHFYFPYLGNKFHESKEQKLDPFIEKLKNTTPPLEYIVEPFCGIFGFSRYCFDSMFFPNAKYFLADIDKTLIDFTNECKGCNQIIYDLKQIRLDNKTEPAAMKAVFDKYPRLDYAKKLIRMLVAGTRGYPTRDKSFKKYDYTKLNNFINANPLVLQDYTKTLEQFKNNERALVYLDPPYFRSFNSDYKTFTKDKIDISKLMIDILDFIQSCKCKVMFIINDDPIIKRLFKDYVKGTYEKMYAIQKKKGNHLIITNF
jgi:site-specific DNA-adenine methylase